MLQRLQTIYLFLAFMALSMMFFFPIVEFNSNQPVPAIPQSLTGAFLNYRVFAFEETADNPATPKNPDFTTIFLENTLSIGISMVLVIVCIALFKNRKIQLTLCWVAVVCMLISVALVYLRINPDKIMTTHRQLGAGAFSLSAALIFTILARRNIKKDEELVRSADRIR